MFRSLNAIDARLTIIVDGRAVDAVPGETLAACLVRHGLVPTRLTLQGSPRAPYCLMGACFECTVETDGRSNVQACLTQVRDGMIVCRNVPE